MAELSERQQQLKAAFTEARGYWSALWDTLLRLSPEFFEAYTAFSSVPWRTGTLPPKIKELIYVAIDASTTHLYEPGVRIHMQNALKHGATQDEIAEVLMLASALGIHSCVLGVPVLIEELQRAGRDALPALGAEQERLKQDFIAARGYWAPFWDQLLTLSPEFFSAYLQFSRCRGATAAWSQDQGADLHRARRGDHASLRAGPAPAYPERVGIWRHRRRDHGDPAAGQRARDP